MKGGLIVRVGGYGLAGRRERRETLFAGGIWLGLAGLSWPVMAAHLPLDRIGRRRQKSPSRCTSGLGPAQFSPLTTSGAADLRRSKLQTLVEAEQHCDIFFPSPDELPVIDIHSL